MRKWLLMLALAGCSTPTSITPREFCEGYVSVQCDVKRRCGVAVGEDCEAVALSEIDCNVTADTVCREDRMFNTEGAEDCLSDYEAQTCKEWASESEPASCLLDVCR